MDRILCVQYVDVCLLIEFSIILYYVFLCCQQSCKCICFVFEKRCRHSRRRCCCRCRRHRRQHWQRKKKKNEKKRENFPNMIGQLNKFMQRRCRLFQFHANNNLEQSSGGNALRKTLKLSVALAIRSFAYTPLTLARNAKKAEIIKRNWLTKSIIMTVTFNI